MLAARLRGPATPTAALRLTKELCCRQCCAAACRRWRALQPRSGREAQGESIEAALCCQCRGAAVRRAGGCASAAAGCGGCAGSCCSTGGSPSAAAALQTAALQTGALLLLRRRRRRRRRRAAAAAVAEAGFAAAAVAAFAAAQASAATARDAAQLRRELRRRARRYTKTAVASAPGVRGGGARPVRVGGGRLTPRGRVGPAALAAALRRQRQARHDRAEACCLLVCLGCGSRRSPRPARLDSIRAFSVGQRGVSEWKALQPRWR